jgi:hypothetical protein
VTKCAPPPAGTHVASVEITALQSTRDVTPENAFRRRAVGTAIDRYIDRHTSVTFILPEVCGQGDVNRYLKLKRLERVTRCLKKKYIIIIIIIIIQSRLRLFATS